MSDEPINILLVDDQPAKLLGYQTILEELGENLLVAHSAREALEVLLQADVALLLVDVVMPELDGFELVELIRAHPRFEKTAVMFVSGVHLSDLDRIRGYSAGAVDYVPVPVVPELLRAKVRVFADLHRKTRQLEALNRELEHRIALRTADLEASTARWRESEERLRLALGSARAGAWEWRFDTGAVHWSPELHALLGVPAEQPGAAPPFLEHVDHDDRARVAGLFESLRVEGGKRAFDVEFRFHRPGHRAPVWIRSTGEVAVDAEGRAIGARGIHQDVSSRKAVELELEREARRKDEFLATLAHELRNPLAPIVSCVRMLKGATLDRPTRERNEAILDRQVSHLVRLVDDLLDVSRISRGTITLHSEPTDLAALVRATVDAFVLKRTGHAVVAELPRRGPFVAVDPVRMAQVVANILDNAVKFTPADGRVTVIVADDGEDAVLSIADTGIGIAAENLDRVFELFAQVERGAGSRGLGIGLALVRRLVELHGGTATATSPGEGHGAELVVRLPRLPEPRAEEAVGPVLVQPVPAQPLRFLIVDDNVDAADTLAELLELSGCSARTAYGGEEAARAGEDFRPDIVLLDLGMPHVDGFEAAKLVRGTTWGSRAKLVAVTGWGQPSDRRKTAEAGFDGHLVKPVDLEVVLRLADLVER